MAILIYRLSTYLTIYLEKLAACLQILRLLLAGPTTDGQQVRAIYNTNLNIA